MVSDRLCGHTFIDQSVYAFHPSPPTPQDCIPSFAPRELSAAGSWQAVLALLYANQVNILLNRLAWALDGERAVFGFPRPMAIPGFSRNGLDAGAHGFCTGIDSFLSMLALLAPIGLRSLCFCGSSGQMDVEDDLGVYIQQQVEQIRHCGADQTQAGRGEQEDNRKDSPSEKDVAAYPPCPYASS
jgi:hypothetical protein